MKCALLAATALTLLPAAVNSAPIEVAKTDSAQLTELPQVAFSLLTCSPGAELYSSYGHTAIRMQIPSEGVDVIFNYGTFDFDTPFFYLRFLNGTLDYMLSTSHTERFVPAYERERRGIVERPLLLNRDQLVDLANRLVENGKPENRYYRYDFFFDNCATRIRDLLFAVGGLDPWPYQAAKDSMTYRDCIHRLVPSSRWDGQGIDLILGSRLDHPVSLWQKAMLPDDLERLLVQANLLGAAEEVLPDRHCEGLPPTTLLDALTSPNAAAALIVALLIIVCLTEWRRGQWLWGADVALFGLTSLLALLFAYLWFVSEIQTTNDNFNVLWASLLSPAQLALLLACRGLGRRPRSQQWLLRLSGASVALCVVYWVCVAAGCQYMPVTAAALSAAVAVRSAVMGMFIHHHAQSSVA